MTDETARLNKEIEALRRESGDRRIKLRAFEEAFDGWDENQRSYMLGLVQLLGQSNTREKGYRELLSLAQAGVRAYDGDPDEPELEEPTMSDQSNPNIDELVNQRVQQELEAKLSEEREKMEQENARQRTNMEIDAQARALGYEPGSSGFALLLHHASKIDPESGLTIAESLGMAHGKVLEELGEVLAAAGTVPQPQPEAAPAAPMPESPTPSFPKSAAAGGSGAPGEMQEEPGEIHDFSDARAAMEEFLDQQAADNPVGQ